ncbi:Rne/Rng family ribonuclease [Actinomadura terrae]|uniref:Rne/Rng family ribonuclease n=1 Tax=Actinomadura terrae TaxID=604353 RepID=UPI001FA7868C|nr:Rne/Rng family ribonuclease [Actinomadura terrae]
MLDNEADSATDNETTDTTAPSVTTRTRRRASRPAGPPPDVEDTPAQAKTGEPAPSGTGSAPSADAGGEPEAGRQVTRGRRTSAARASAATATEATVPEAAASDAAASDAAAPEAAAPEASAPEQGEEAAPVKKTTRTRTRAKSGAAKAEETGKGEETAEPVPLTGAETSPAAETPKGEAPEAPAEKAEKPEKTSTTRTRTRRRTSAAAPPVTPDEPDVPAAPIVPEVPAVPGTGGEPDASRVSETEPASGVGVPGVMFQPPMVVFQPPQPKAETPVRPKDEPKAEEPAADQAEPGPAGPDDEDDGEDRPSRRRRRRGGRGRGRGRDGLEDDAHADDGAEAEDAGEPRDSRESKDAKDGKDAKDEQPAKAPKTTKAAKAKAAKEAKDAAKEAAKAEQDEADDDEGDGQGATSRRRRRRRRRSGADGEAGVQDDPPNTVVHVRDARAVEDEVQSVRGSTRLEAKKQRRREGREQGRRRPPVITEAEFLARRESVERVMVVRQEGERTQIAVLEDDVLVEHYVNRATHQSYVGNVYLGKVQNVLPSMEAAFVDIGKGRNAVLYAGEVNWDVAGLEGQPRRIESALKSGQSVLVQVTKDPLGHKGARLTSQVSLPGRYLVYVPDGSMTGISRKLPDKERSRLKSILKKVMPENAGVIVRTAAEGATEEELARDVSRLAAQWDNIQKKVKGASAPSLLYGEPDLTIRVVRDIFNEDFTKLVVSGGDAWDTVSDYVQYVAPHLADRVERWDGAQDVLGAFRVDEQIAKALDRKVWLPSGGSLVIDRTEAMTVIDVNTGKFTGQGGNLEETVTRNNLEAAEEIVRQLRLRDIGGIVVIDFIDMVLENNRDLVLRRLVECLSRDRTKHQVAEVTSLGLVQMTRKRVGQGLLEAFSETCESCNGRGIHVHLSPVEPKPDKAAGKETGRRRKRKGEVERAVEEKLAKHDAKAEPKAEDEPEQREEPEAARPARARAKKSGPAKRPAGPPPDVDAEEAPAQAAVEAAQAAAEAADAPPGTLDAAEPVTVNGAAPAAESNGVDANGAAPAASASASDEAADGAEEGAGTRRRRTRRPRATAQAAAESGDADA